MQNLQNWNSYAFSYTGKLLQIYLNGQLISQQSTSITTFKAVSSTCYLGLSQNTNSNSPPIYMQIRHLMIRSDTLSNSTILNTIHHFGMPKDNNLLTYFAFSKDFNNQQTYYNDPSYTTYSQNTQISWSRDSEFVCYCTSSYPNYFKVSKLLYLNAISLSSQQSKIKVDNTGVKIVFQILALKPSSFVVADELLFQLQSYASIYLTNNGTNLRVDVYGTNGVVGYQLIMSSYKFRYSIWTEYVINIYPANATLYVDGTKIQTITMTKMTLPTTSSSLKIGQTTYLEYLINNITIQNTKGQNIYAQIFTENQMTSAQWQNMSISGTVTFGTNNQYCSYTNIQKQTYWNGINCIDNRLFAQFNYNNKAKNNQTQFLVNNPSTLSNSQSTTFTGSGLGTANTMSIEVWFRDLSQSLNQTQVLFENQLTYGQITQIQLSIQSGSVSTSLKQVTCYSQYSRNYQASISPVKTYNQWNHISCLGSPSSPSLTAILYSSPDLVNSTDSGNFLLYDGSNFLTSIGSSVDGSNPFSGFMRELRIWNITKSLQQTQIYRFQMITSASMGSSLLMYYFALNDQINPLLLSNMDQNQMFYEQNIDYPSVQYVLDKDLIVCQDGLFYNGNCCQQFNFQNVDIKLAYSSTNNQIVVQIDSSTVGNSYVWNTISADFSLSSIGYNFNTYDSAGAQTDYLSYLKPNFSFQKAQNFSVSTYLINPQAYNLTITATIYSDYFPLQTIQKTKTIQLTCPMVFLSIIPQYVTDSHQIVSQNQSTSPVINAEIMNQCYIPSNGSVVTVNVGQLSWSFNLTSSKFNTIFTTSTDTYSATATSKSSLTGSSKYVQVSIAPATTTSSLKFSNSINLQFEQISLNLGLSQNYQLMNILQGSDIIQDFSLSTISGGNGLYSSINFLSKCPSNVFTSQSNYLTNCQFKQYGYFDLQTNNLLVNANFPYFFSFYVSISGTSILQLFSLQVVFYKDGSSSSLGCPNVQFQTSSYTYTIASGSSQVIQLIPDPYMYCSGTYYSIAKANWTAFDSSTSLSYNNIFIYGGQQIYQQANMTSATLKNVVAGSSIQINLNVQLTSTTAPTINITTSTFLYVAQSNLVAKVLAYSSSSMSTPLTSSNNTIQFLDQEMILSANQSNDPDNSSAVMSYVWGCPSEITTLYSCSSLQRGTGGGNLYLNALQRVKCGLKYNQLYTFSVTVSSNNPYKQPQQQLISVQFAPPLKSDYLSTSLMPATCDSLQTVYFPTSPSLGGLFYLNSTYPRLLPFDRYNYTAVPYNISYSMTSGSSCKAGSLVEQVMVYYIYDAGFTQQAVVMMQQGLGGGGSGNVSVNGVVNVMLSQYNLGALPLDQYYSMTVYQFTVRSGSNDTVALNMQNIYFYHAKAMLIANLAVTSITLDLYDPLTLDASPSSDPELLNLPTYAYKWSCPSKISCPSSTAPILTLTALQRSTGGANSPNVAYNYSVQYTDGSRTSLPAVAIVNFTKQASYAYCVTCAINGQNYSGWRADENGTYFVQYGQDEDFNVVVGSQSSCNSVSLQNGTVSQNQMKTSFYSYVSGQMGVINIANGQFMRLTPGVSYSLLYTQTFIMNTDKTPVYSASQSFNIVLMPPRINPQVSYSQIVFLNSTNNKTSISLNALTTDQINSLFLYTWSCPDAFGSSICTQSYATNPNNSYQLAYNYSQLSQLAYPNDISALIGTSYKFQITIQSIDLKRSQVKTIYMLILDSSYSAPFTQKNVIQNCTIQLYNQLNNGETLNFFQQNIFYLWCGNLNITGGIMQNYSSFVWTIDGLNANFDYFVSNNYLYLEPYVGMKVQGNEMTVNLQIPALFSSAIKQTFYIKFDEVDVGGNGISIVNINDNSLRIQTIYAFSPNYDMIFDGIQESNTIGMLFQLRGFYILYNNMQIIYTLKDFNEINQNLIYDEMSFPYVNQLYVDFFDMNYNYIGSYDVLGSGGYQIQLQTVQQIQFEWDLQNLMSQTQTIYKQNKTLFEIDLETCKQLSQIIAQNLLSNNDNLTQIGLYQLQILSYLSNQFISSINNYNTSWKQDNKTKQNLEKKLIYILSNIFDENIPLTDTYLPSLYSILNQINSDWYYLTYEGDQTETLRQLYIDILSFFNDYLQTSSQISTYLSKIRGLQQKAVLNGLTITQSNIYNPMSYLSNNSQTSSGSAPSQSSIQRGQVLSSFIGSSNRQYMQILTNFTAGDQPFQMQNQIYSADQVYCSTQQQLQTLGVDSIEVTFQNSQNSTGISQSILYINAYDTNFSKIAVDYTQPASNTVLVYYQLTLSSNFTKIYSKNVNSYTIQCVYFNDSASSWSTFGQKVVKFDAVLGVVNCSSSHLSTFTVVYQNALSGPGSGVKGGKVNSSLSGNSSTKVFDVNASSYTITLVIVTFVVSATIFLALIFSQINEQPLYQQIPSDTFHRRSYKEILILLFQRYHTILSGWIYTRPVGWCDSSLKAHVQLLFMWIQLAIISLLFLSVASGQDMETVSVGQIVGFDIFIIIVTFLLKILGQTVNSGIYFCRQGGGERRQNQNDFSNIQHEGGEEEKENEGDPPPKNYPNNQQQQFQYQQPQQQSQNLIQSQFSQNQSQVQQQQQQKFHPNPLQLQQQFQSQRTYEKELDEIDNNVATSAKNKFFYSSSINRGVLPNKSPVLNKVVSVKKEQKNTMDDDGDIEANVDGDGFGGEGDIFGGSGGNNQIKNSGLMGGIQSKDKKVIMDNVNVFRNDGGDGSIKGSNAFQSINNKQNQGDHLQYSPNYQQQQQQFDNKGMLVDSSRINLQDSEQNNKDQFHISLKNSNVEKQSVKNSEQQQQQQQYPLGINKYNSKDSNKIENNINIPPSNKNSDAPNPNSPNSKKKLPLFPPNQGKVIKFTCPQYLALIFQICALYFLLIAIYVLMKEIPSNRHLNAWLASMFILYFIIVIVFEPIQFLIYAWVLTKSKKNSFFVWFVQVVTMGNAHFAIYRDLVREINARVLAGGGLQ